MADVLLQSVLTCPDCQHQAEEVMPTIACRFFHECPECHAVLSPKPGDCCVFCSYGTVPCPPMQEGVKCCGSNADADAGRPIPGVP